ncbi:hypothetical protein F5H01DRAFT_409301 [Linnemannia elongata]|nr:hypothetical protein F5H01DRAFT_409301 [Linnemannia elongata]
MPSLSWSIFVAVLLIILGSVSNDLVSAVPVPVPADDQPSLRVRDHYSIGFPEIACPTDTSTPVVIAVPTRVPFRFPPSQIGLPVETPVVFKRQDDDSYKTVPPGHATEPVEEEPESESESEFVDGVELSKRRAMPNSWIRWIGSGGFNQRRDLPSTPTTTTTTTPELKSGSEPVFESVDDVGLSKRRMQVYGSVRYVNPADIRKRDLSPSASATTTPELKSGSESESESVDDVGLSKRRMQVYGSVRYVNPADIRKRDLPSSASITDITPEEESEFESEKGVELSKRRAILYGKVEYVGHPKYYTRETPLLDTTDATEALED